MWPFTRDIKQIKLPTYFFISYILLIPFESILAVDILGFKASYATILATITSISVLFYIIAKPELMKLTKMVIAWIGFFVWTGLSIFWSFDKSISGYDFFFLVKHLFFLILISSYPFNLTEKTFIKRAVILSGLLLSGKIILEIFNLGSVSTLARATISHGYYKADPNHTASSLLMPIAFIISDYIERKNLRIWEFLFALILFGTLIITGSRGGFAALLFMIITIIIVDHKIRGISKPILVLLFSFGVIAAVFSISRLDVLNRYIPVSSLDRYSSNRIPIWEGSLKKWTETPFQGYGYGAFPYLDIQTASRYKAAHNIFIGALVETGIIGLILMALATASSLNFKSKDSFSRATKAGLLGILVSSLFLHTLNYDYFWIAMIFAEISSRTKYATQESQNFELVGAREPA